MMNRNMLRQAQTMQKQAMQKKIREMQDEIAQTTTEASVGVGGTRVESIEIGPGVVDPEDVEMLQDLVTAVVNQAIDQSRELATEKMNAIIGRRNIPDLGF